MTTPPRASATFMHSTPHSKGSASDKNSGQQTTREHYAPFLNHDLASERYVSLEQFLSGLLRPSSPARAAPDHARLTEIANMSDVQEKLDAFKSATEGSGLENRMYEPFVEFVNLCLQKLGLEEFLLCRNDPIILSGSYASRKPDVGEVAASSITDVPDRRGVGAAGRRFQWGEFWAFWEFKPGDLPEFSPSNTSETTATTTKQKANKTEASGSSTGVRKSSRRAEAPPPAQPVVDAELPAAEPPAGNHTPRSLVEKPEIQCAGYALEMLALSRIRHHVFGVLVGGLTMELQYYDRSAIVKSHRLEFTTPDGLVTFLGVLSDLTNSLSTQYPHGLLDSDTPPAPPPNRNTKTAWDDLYRDTKMTFGGWGLNLENILFQSHGLIGRGTVVVRAKVMKSPQRAKRNNGDVVVKWSWVPTTRRKEADFIKMARDAAASKNPDMLKHLPALFCAHEADTSYKIFLEDLDTWYEARQLRIIVQEPLMPLNDEKLSPDKLAKAFKDTFKAYRCVVEYAKLIHRDISTGNLMYRLLDGGDVEGVLNDFDMAKSTVEDASNTSTSRHRTGTKPFMARDLLVEEPPRHLPRHDLESFLYVLAFLVCETKGTLDHWRFLSMEDLKTAKASRLSEGFPSVKPGYEDFATWLPQLEHIFEDGSKRLTAAKRRVVVNAGLKAKGRPPLEEIPMPDEETLDGTVTFDTFFASLV
ncbi:hypothetical protein FB45DRAFT_818918 [Roridomyces roridus]|uniref:Protein kinase domain-containing protein n=1 Tax=Roridomyces roridus TaxID=1738132 RepID=A0AAD7G1I0_9AGAR|nr:hypothetical protein FB45DRAFT_842477 [Roridomyces roridus]KAJ7649797.1 hypothetical protein FB45DRAFT_818918 [Roridomyces roridus]